MREAGSVVTRERLIDEVWDVNWFGSTKTLDVHVSSLRRKLGDDSASPRFIHTVRGVGFRFAGPHESRTAPVSLRTRLLAAFAYVLVLVIVALEVPLALNLSRRVDAEIKSEAQGQAQLLAAGASGRLDDRAELAALLGAPRDDLGGRVIVVDPRGRPDRRLRRGRARRRAFVREPPRDRSRASTGGPPRARGAANHSTRTFSSRRSRSSYREGVPARCASRRAWTPCSGRFATT